MVCPVCAGTLMVVRQSSGKSCLSWFQEVFQLFGSWRFSAERSVKSGGFSGQIRFILGKRNAPPDRKFLLRASTY
jgi:hypothetical protein